jgi:hypothetical protein
MIDREILDILGDTTDSGQRLNGMVDQFRRGRDVSHLVGLLDSSHADLASIGAWILGELPFELYNSDRFVHRLRRLVDHTDPLVRFHALGALFPALNPQEVDTQALLLKLRNDPNEGVRTSAEAAATRLSLA